MKLKENYERFFGKIEPIKEETSQPLNESVKAKFSKIATLLAKKYPNAPLTIKEGFVWMGSKKVELAEKFLSRSSSNIHEMVRSFSNSQSRRLI